MIEFFNYLFLIIVRPFLLVWIFMWIQAGNSYFSTSLEKAQIEYKKATQFAIPEQTIAFYNLGNSYYKQGEFNQAQEAYTQALNKADEKQQALIYYNLGNVHYRLGEAQLKSDVEATIRLWEAAITHYEEALKRNPNDVQAKENIEFIKKKLEELKKKSQSKSSEQSEGGEGDESYEDDKKRIEENEQKEQENYKNYKKYNRDKEGSSQDKTQPYW